MELADLFNSPIQAETLAARTRTGKLIGTAIEQGKLQVQEIIPLENGSSAVIPLSEFLPLDEVIEALRAL